MKELNLHSTLMYWCSKVARCIKFLLLAGCLLTGAARQSQAAEILKVYDFQGTGARLEGYIPALLDPNSDRGVAVVGNYGMPGVGQGVHFATINETGNVTLSKLLLFNADDVRAVSISTISPGLFAVIVQVRSAGVNSHTSVVVIDEWGNIIDNTDIGVQMDYGRNLFPIHSVMEGDFLYICGYACNGGDYPADPLPTDDKSAFVIRFDLKTHYSYIRYFQTNINTTPPPPGSGSAWNGLFNDYDRALRLRVLDGRLFVMGAVNGTAYTYWGSGHHPVNICKSWVSELDTYSLAPSQSAYFGTDYTAFFLLPTTTNGYYALDLVLNKETQGFYCLSNEIQWHTWQISHLEPNLQMSVLGGGAPNTIAYTSGGVEQLGNGLIVTPGAPNRVSMYGMVGSNHPLTNIFGYSIVTQPNMSSAAPIVVGMDLGFDGAGIHFSGLSGNLLGNAHGYASPVPYKAAHWNNSSRDEWCNLPFAVAADPVNGAVDELMLMGHVLNPVTGYANPRWMRTNAYGAINSCLSAQELDLQGVSYKDMYRSVIYQPHMEDVCDYSAMEVVAEDMLPDIELDCSIYNIYSKNNAILTVAKGLYPNPATDQVTITLGTEAGAMEKVNIRLTDLTGRVVFATDITASGQQAKVALPGLSPGIYQVTVQYANKHDVYKLVIQ